MDNTSMHVKANRKAAIDARRCSDLFDAGVAGSACTQIEVCRHTPGAAMDGLGVE
jgi:hypothetical protein